MDSRSGIAGSQRGQAVLEYTLVLMVVVMLILSLVYRFHSAFRAYTANFFGGYVYCLLEVGELPGIATECAEEFKNFSLKDGKQVVTTEWKDAGGSGRNGGDGAGDSGDQANENANESGGGDGKGSETIHNGTGPRSSTNVGGSFGRFGARRSTPVANVVPVGDKESGGDEAIISRSTSGVGRVQGDYKRGKVKMDYTYTSRSEANERDGRPSVANTSVTVEEGNGALRPKKISEAAQRAPAKAGDINDEGFTLGAFIRWLIIACLIVAMVMFFGGQLLQISKSREKGGGD